LEQTCRNVRVSFEENRDFNIASDFYIAEMEALHAQLSFARRHFFSVAALYHFVSYYGAGIGTGLRVLAYLFVLHLELTRLVQSPETISLLNNVGLMLFFEFSHPYKSLCWFWLFGHELNDTDYLAL